MAPPPPLTCYMFTCLPQVSPEDETTIRRLLNMVMLINPGSSQIVPYTGAAALAPTAHVPYTAPPARAMLALPSTWQDPRPSSAPMLALPSTPHRVPPFFVVPEDRRLSPDGLPSMSVLSAFSCESSRAARPSSFSYSSSVLCKDLASAFESAGSSSKGGRGLKNLVILRQGKGEGNQGNGTAKSTTQGKKNGNKGEGKDNSKRKDDKGGKDRGKREERRQDLRMLWPKKGHDGRDCWHISSTKRTRTSQEAWQQVRDLELEQT